MRVRSVTLVGDMMEYTKDEHQPYLVFDADVRWVNVMGMECTDTGLSDGGKIIGDK